jgi:hypothetical protein
VAAPVQECPLVSKTHGTEKKKKKKKRKKTAPLPSSPTAALSRIPSSLTLPLVLDRVFNTHADPPDASTLR